MYKPNFKLSAKKSSRDLEKKDIYEHGKEVLEGTRFGGLLFFVYLQDIQSNQYNQMYVRIDNQCIDESLRDFLDNFYPSGNLYVGTHRIPPVG